MFLLVFKAAKDHFSKRDDVGETTIGSHLVVDGPSSFIEIRSEIAYSLPVLIFLLGYVFDGCPLAAESEVAVVMVLETVNGVLHLQKKVNNDNMLDDDEEKTENETQKQEKEKANIEEKKLFVIVSKRNVTMISVLIAADVGRANEVVLCTL